MDDSAASIGCFSKFFERLFVQESYNPGLVILVTTGFQFSTEKCDFPDKNCLLAADYICHNTM